MWVWCLYRADDPKFYELFESGAHNRDSAELGYRSQASAGCARLTALRSRAVRVVCLYRPDGFELSEIHESGACIELTDPSSTSCTTLVPTATTARSLVAAAKRALAVPT